MTGKAETAFVEFAREITATDPRSNSPISRSDIDVALERTLDQLDLNEDSANTPSLRDRLLSASEEDHLYLLELLRRRIGEGRGETIFDVGLEESGEDMQLSISQCEAAIAKLHDVSSLLLARCSVLSKKRFGTELAHNDTSRISAKLLIRQQPTSVTDLLEIRVAVVGNVDAGKSTLLGVLTKGILDDGRGKARVNLFRHKHEIESGRTSSVGTEILGFDADCNAILPTSANRKLTWEDISSRASKVISFIDLAGHERYLKTTVFGMTGCAPDFAMLMIGANAGLIGMSKEHLGLALALNVPVLVVVTKIDMCPPNVLDATLKQLTKILKSPGARKLPMFVNNTEDVINIAAHFVSERICPIFQVSNVNGQNIDLLRTFLNILPFHGNYHTSRPFEFLVSDTFSVPFAGCVVSGVCTSGIVHVGDTVWIGPDATDNFVQTTIRSIQRKRVNAPCALAGQSASFALKRTRRKDVRKGMVLLQYVINSPPPQAVREFNAEVLILYHQTTIQKRYQAMCHVGSVAQTCQILEINREILRTGDRGIVRFRFIQRAEYITPGQRILFREGRTKGLGVVRETL